MIVGPLELKVCRTCKKPKEGWKFKSHPRYGYGDSVQRIVQENQCNECRREVMRGKQHAPDYGIKRI